MPLYRHECENGHSNLHQLKIDERNESQECIECGIQTKRNMKKEQNQQNAHVFEPYFDENLAHEGAPDGVFVESRKQKRKLKDQLGLRNKKSYVE